LTNYFKKGRFDDPAVSLTPTAVSIITCNPPELKSSANLKCVSTYKNIQIDIFPKSAKIAHIFPTKTARAPSPKLVKRP
jgi:hypothetical protein